MTDRRGDVLANLRENIQLNRLRHRVKVAQLSWGGREKEIRELPAEIRSQSPFKVQYSLRPEYNRRRDAYREAMNVDVVQSMIRTTSKSPDFTLV